MELFGVRRTWLGDADPVIGEGGMQIGGPDFWHVATGAVSYGYGAGGAGMNCRFFFDGV
jgi:hypothetical protein